MSDTPPPNKKKEKNMNENKEMNERREEKEILKVV